jgi:hypothetical protein
VSLLPDTRRGRRNAEQEAKHQAQRLAFANELIELSAVVGFKMAVRDWCYYLEGAGAIDKSEFAKAEHLITDLRKDPDSPLPLDFTSEDESRKAKGVVMLDDDTPNDHARWVVGRIESNIDSYQPIVLSHRTGIHIECVVEKEGLRKLFLPVCEEFEIPVTNNKGDADLHSRAAICRRIADSPASRFMVLYFGDHDPKGLQLAQNYIKLLHDLEGKLGTLPHIELDYFGLHAGQIEDNGLVWIEGLVTGGRDASGKKRDLSDTVHPDHKKPYVRDYLRRYGARKVEANAVFGGGVDLGRRILRETIDKYINPEDVEAHAEALKAQRDSVRKIVQIQLRRAVA